MNDKFYSLEQLKSSICQTLKQEGIAPESITNLINKKEEMRKKDIRIPSTPHKYYSNKGWKSYSDLFGLPDINFYSFEELKIAINQALKLECIEAGSVGSLKKKYQNLCKKDIRIPSDPRTYYSNQGWKDFRDAFSLPKIEHYSLDELKIVIRQSLRVKNIDLKYLSNLKKTYRELFQKDPRAPSNPAEHYAKKGWENFSYLFGLQSKEFYSLEELKSKLKQSLAKEGIEAELIPSLTNKYKELRLKDPRIPSNPSISYAKNGWKNTRDLFGLSDIIFYSIEELKYAIKQKLEKEGTKPEEIKGLAGKYNELRTTDIRMPSRPDYYYSKNEWKSTQDLFGFPEINYYSIKKLKTAIRTLLEKEGIEPSSIRSLTKRYQEMYRNDVHMPFNPSAYYSKKGWKNYRDLFGMTEIEFYSLKELKSAIKQALKQENLAPESIVNLTKKYCELRKKDVRMTSIPNRYYATQGWIDYPDLFGLKKIELYSLNELKSAIKQHLDKRNIHPESIRSLIEHYHTLRKVDARIPRKPHIYYAKNGWKSIRDIFNLSVSKWYSYNEAQHAIQVYLNENNIILQNSNITDLYRLIAQHSPRIPENPSFIYADYWQGLEYFFQRKTFYPFDIARNIAISKNYAENDITKITYGHLVLTDPMFPAFPDKAYFGQWRNLQHFLGINDGRYKNLIDAQRSAVKIANHLGIKITSLTYPKIAKLDTRLPPSIDRYKPYQNEWQGWKEFCGTKKYDIEKAREITISNRWFKYKDYEHNHHKDDKLPAEPVKYYGVKNYKEFIEFDYWDIKQVKKFCKDNKISTTREYAEHAKNNIYLKVRYQTIKGFTKAIYFLYEPKLFDEIIGLGYEQWAMLGREFLINKAKRGFSNKSNHINIFLLYLISKNSLPIEPFKLFLAGNNIEPIESLIKEKSEGKYLESTIIDFLKFVMGICCYDRDEDTGELITINPDFNFRHPYENLNVELDSKSRPNQTVKPPLDFVYMDAAKEFLIPDFIQDDNGNTRPCTFFTDLANAHTLFDSDWFEVDIDTYLHAITDPNCLTERQKVTKKVGTTNIVQTVHKIWSPVRTIAMYVLFSLPLRGIQVCYLDSGEADSMKLIEQEDGSLAWIVNDNPLAGRLDRKGFLYKESNDEVGMKVSTNKTSTKEGGYTVPWMPKDVARWIIRLRDWQSKYNPLITPTPWSDIATPTKVHQSVLKKRGEQCFLFRDPRDSLKRKNNPPGSQPFLPNSAFRAFEKLLYLIQNDDMPLTQLRTGSNGTSDSDYDSMYSPHCLRVSHISALLFEGEGLDPVIVQKLVGHSNLVMTIYYGIINSEQMRDKLTGQYKEIAANKQKQYQASLLSRNLEEAKGELIFLSNGAGQVTWENSAVRFKDFGMCPVANGRCDEGGFPINPNAKQKIYSKAKSCFQCRFFVTGPAFLGGLVAKFNEVNVARKRINNRIDSLENKKKKKRLQKKQAEDKQLPTDEIKLQLEQLNTSIDAEQVKFYDISTDQAAIFSKVLKCIQRINDVHNEEKDTKGVALILNRDETEVGVSLNESSDFRVLAEICEDAQIYDSIDDSEAVNLREKYLDTMLASNGFDAMFFKLDEDQSRFIGNQMQKLLLNRLDGWQSVEQLIYGEMQLSDLMTDNDGNIQILREEMSLLIKVSNSDVTPNSIQIIES
ncbi:VPA1269 family protein [Vibrio metschnikovii]|uniref:VPA1269 family protein n=1 Tax=Vibrio metschnikovii TaxID=28172 RepID=UPI002FE62D63